MIPANARHALDSRFTGRNLLGMNPSTQSPSPFFHWLSVNQIRKMQRMRRETVIRAMESGELPFERRGRIRYPRLADVQAWEECRLSNPETLSTFTIDPDLAALAG